MPFKAEAACRRHIPKQQHRVTNWAEYDAGLRARGSLTVWFTPEAVAAWAAAPRTTRGGQPFYSDLAIATALTLRGVFRLALHQTEGLVGSILQLLGLDLPVPNHSTLSRRAEMLEVPRPKAGSEPVHLLVDSTGLKLCGPGEWLMEKHGTKRRRAWRVLHLAMDADTGRIVASVLTDKDADDGSQVGLLLDRVEGAVASVTGDGAYDRDDVYAEVAARHPAATVIVPPRANAVPSAAAQIAPTQRDRHLRCITERGRMGWQRVSGYNWRALVEADISRWKRVTGGGLRFQTEGRQATEVAIAVDVLNRMLEPGRPKWGLSSSGYRWRSRWLVASGCHELDKARGSRGGPRPSAQPSVQARDVQGRRGRNVLQVGLSEAHVSRAAQAAEPDAPRQTAFNPGARAVERPPLRRVLPLAHGLDSLVSALTPKRQRARRRFGAGAHRAARAGATSGLGEADVHGAGAPRIMVDHPVHAPVPLRAGDRLGFPVDRKRRDGVALARLDLPTRVRAHGADQLDTVRGLDAAMGRLPDPGRLGGCPSE